MISREKYHPLACPEGYSHTKHFIKAGIVPVELGRLFSRMYDFRQKSDYGDFVKIQPEKVGEWFEQAVAFINEIDRIIEGSLG